jgi:hypothetical protein
VVLHLVVAVVVVVVVVVVVAVVAAAWQVLSEVVVYLALIIGPPYLSLRDRVTDAA